MPSEWISVKDRLPNKEALCANFKKGAYGYGEMIIGYIDYNEGYERYDAESASEILENVTHWQPLPEPPDVVEVVHGEWVHIKDYGGGNCSGHCSVCWTLQEADNPSALKGSFRYCRWCGAKMDGERRSENDCT